MNDFFKDNILGILVLSVLSSLVANFIWSIHCKYGAKYSCNWRHLKNIFEEHLLDTIAVGLVFCIICLFSYDSLSPSHQVNKIQKNIALVSEGSQLFFTKPTLLQQNENENINIYVARLLKYFYKSYVFFLEYSRN